MESVGTRWGLRYGAFSQGVRSQCGGVALDKQAGRDRRLGAWTDGAGRGGGPWRAGLGGGQGSLRGERIFRVKNFLE